MGFLDFDIYKNTIEHTNLIRSWLKEIYEQNKEIMENQKKILERYCREHGITMTCFADAQNLDFIDVMDVCAIFGNAIDNAIECEQKIDNPQMRLIKVNVYTQNHFLLIRVENYCEDQVDFDRGLPVTTKTDSQMHGYGVKSMKRAVEKYGGHLHLEQEDVWFRITALIPLPS